MNKVLKGSFGRFKARSRLRWLRRRTLLLLMAVTARVELGLAVEDSATRFSLDSSTSVLTEPKNSTVRVEGFLRLENTQYMTQIPGNSQLNQDAMTVGNIRLERTTGWRAAVEMTAARSVSLGHSHFALSESYLGQTWNDEHTQVFVGRKLESWSLVDSDWQLGQWQPTFGQLDMLRPIDQGLTGFFWKQQSGEHELLSFATPVFIPSMGPDIQEKNGSLVSDSRWYRQPSPTFAYQGVITRVVYSLDIPDAAKLVSNPGGGIRYKYGAGSQGFWFSVNYGYKPINSLLLKYKTVLKTPEIDPRGEVAVSPVVGHHTLGGGELGYNFHKGMVAVSYLADRPQIQYPDDRWFQQQPGPFQAVAVHSDFNLPVPYLSQELGLSFNYLRIAGGAIQDVDAEKNDEGALFANRFNFSNAAEVKFNFRSDLFKRPAQASFKYLREFEQKGVLLGAELSLFAAANWMLNLGADILGVDDEKNNQDGTFLNQFRANDRYYGGMSYVF